MISDTGSFLLINFRQFLNIVEIFFDNKMVSLKSHNPISSTNRKRIKYLMIVHIDVFVYNKLAPLPIRKNEEPNRPLVKKNLILNFFSPLDTSCNIELLLSLLSLQKKKKKLVFVNGYIIFARVNSFFFAI